MSSPQKCCCRRCRHDAKLCAKPLPWNCRRHRRTRRACRCNPRRNDIPYNTKLVADLLLLEGPRPARQRSVPVRLGEERRRLVGHGDFGRNAVVGGSRNKGVNFRARRCERGLVGFAERLCEGCVSNSRIEEDRRGPTGSLGFC
jgi:hypothetical protein